MSNDTCSAQTPYPALTYLIKALGQIADEPSELCDTCLREATAKVLTHGFVHADPYVTVPDSFGVYAPQADAKVARALEALLADLDLASAGGVTSTKPQDYFYQGMRQCGHVKADLDFVGCYLNPNHALGNWNLA